MLLCHPGKPWLRAFGHRIASLQSNFSSKPHKGHRQHSASRLASKGPVLGSILLDGEVIPTQHDSLITRTLDSLSLSLPYRSSAKFIVARTAARG